MKQRTFASAAWSAKGKVTRRERFLAEMDAVIPWARLLALIEPHHPKAGAGRQPHPMERMLRIHGLAYAFRAHFHDQRRLSSSIHCTRVRLCRASLVRYDANGNPETVTTADDPKAPALRYIYDAVNRVVAVESGDVIIGSHVYKDDEPDLRNQLDDRTMRIGADAVRQSGSIGPLEAMAYARPYGKYFDFVRFDQSTFTFGLPSEFGVSASDAVVSNSIARRRFVDIERDASTKAQDKFGLPSNVIFLPPEYATINCAPGCQFSGFTMKAAGVAWDTDVVQSSPVELKATAITPNSCNHVLCRWYIGPIEIGYGNPFTYAFPTLGRVYVDGACECSPCDATSVGTLTIDVTTPPPGYCEVGANQDGAAKYSLGGYPIKEPFERGHTMFCDGGGAFTFGYYATSWDTGNDPCAVGVAYNSITAGGAHTHPWFDTAAEFLAGDGCWGETTAPTLQELDQYNTITNKNFGPGDHDWVTTSTKQLYMRVPSGTQYKVLRLVNGQTSPTTLP